MNNGTPQGYGFPGANNMQPQQGGFGGQPDPQANQPQFGQQAPQGWGQQAPQQQAPQQQAPQGWGQQAPQQQGGFGQAPQQGGFGQAPQQGGGAAALLQANRAALMNAAMGVKRAGQPPIGSDQFVVTSTEVDNVGLKKKPAFILHIKSLTSGIDYKIMRFLTSDYPDATPMIDFKSDVGRICGMTETDPVTGVTELDARVPDWVNLVSVSPGPFVGFKLFIETKQKYDSKTKKPLVNDRGEPNLRHDIQRVG